ncbi:hypothetical protein M501DRAFT_994656 [Patellaria atrata CBS 101060]|uniref:F-box domain-containing protein n=1 Tax=Patellaria atrata CBS 101060 TaxID=1346257 RepID=A0A9P4VS64_9PEZI|nr:hypothetical protein M501DRAFT_994656 [Patellaria atrata CBS 101060]
MTLDSDVLLWSTVLAILLSSLILSRSIYVYTRSSQRKPKHFPFLRLPPELRSSIYEYLVEWNPIYPPLPPLPESQLGRLVKWVAFIVRWNPRYSYRNPMLLVNRQIHAEFIELLCMRKSFLLKVDKFNQNKECIWPIPSSTIAQIRKCDLKIIATSDMLEADDPRSITEDFSLRDRVCDQLARMVKLQRVNLHIHALGDPLWNPLWMWYYISLAFKDVPNIKFRAITFSLHSISPIPNLLAKNKEGLWEWRCPFGHQIEADANRVQPIREFCSNLYKECETCDAPSTP